MSSPPKGKAETRAGHPPAVKAGGMRIVQKHPHAADAKEEKDKDEQDWESGTRVSCLIEEPQNLNFWSMLAREKSDCLVHLNQLCSFQESLQGVIKTSLQLQLKWPIRNLILLWKSFLPNSMSTSTSTSLANESCVQDSVIVFSGWKDYKNCATRSFALIAYGFNGLI